MGVRAANLVLLSALALVLGACSHDSGEAVANANVFPTEFKQEIVATLQNLFVKNETIRVTDAVISTPQLQLVDKDQRYTACISYTAHGVEPGMVGNAVRIAYFYGGHLNQLVPATGDQCKNAAYTPFRELEKACIGKGCK
jgi:hypothetical protein